MTTRWPLRRWVLAVALLLTCAAAVAFLWADGQTDSGLYCSSAYPETSGDASCVVQDLAGPAFLISTGVAAAAFVAELVTPSRTR